MVKLVVNKNIKHSRGGIIYNPEGCTSQIFPAVSELLLHTKETGNGKRQL